jgi:hypothetical protein
VQAARKEKLAGATVIRGIVGVGYHGVLQNSAWSLSEHVPIIVEIVDSAEKVSQFVRGPLDGILIGGMLTLERAAVMMYRHRGQDQANHFQLAPELRPLSTVPAISPGSHMTSQENSLLLRVFIGESDKLNGNALYMAILEKVRELGLAGATVLRGSEGFGARSVVHGAGPLEMSTDLPILIEIVDEEEKIKILLPHLESMVKEGMITMEYVAVFMYRHGEPR